MQASSDGQSGGRLSLQADEVDVWTVRLDEPDGTNDRLWEVLDQAERARAGEFRRDDLRRRFVAARGGARVILGGYLGQPGGEVVLAVDARGKPRLAEVQDDAGATRGGEPVAGLQFNVAHSGELALVAGTAGCDVGVDIEQFREVEKLEQLAERYFHPAEAAAVLSAEGGPRSERFLRCWTAKEAVLKALGVGLGADLRAFNVVRCLDEPAWVELPAAERAAAAGRCWTQMLAAPHGYVAAVATWGQPRTVRIRDFAM